MPHKNPLVTIIIPAYNAQRTLARTLDSILAQTYPHLEIIIINDGSTDNTISVCKQYAAKDRRIKYHTQPNRGVSSARNHGINIARGDYITFMDADDTLTPQTIASALHYIQKYSVDVVRYNVSCTTDLHKSAEVDQLWELADKVVTAKDIKNILWHFITPKQNIHANTPALLIKRNKIIKFREDITYMEDTEFYLRLLLNIKSIFFLNKTLYYYNYNAKSATREVSPTRQAKNLSMVKLALDAMQKTLAQHQLLESKNLKLGIETRLFATTHNRVCALHRLPYGKLYKFVKDIYQVYLPPRINPHLLQRKQRLLYFLVKHRLYFAYICIVKIKQSLK